MTERIDSLLHFASSGQNNPLVHERVSLIVEKTVAAVEMHPDGRNVSIAVDQLPLGKRPLSWRVEVFKAADNFKAIIPISNVASGWFSRQEAAAHEEVGYILSRGADFSIMDQS